MFNSNVHYKKHPLWRLKANINPLRVLINVNDVGKQGVDCYLCGMRWNRINEIEKKFRMFDIYNFQAFGLPH